MKLVEKYLYAIERQLPRTGKDEVIAELRSTLLDTIEGTYGEEANDEDISEVLKSFGAPSEVAKEYGKPRYIINPALTDIYWLVVKIVFFAMLGSFTIIYLVRLFTDGGVDINIPLGIVGVFSNAIGTTLSSVGTITIIFAIISRYMQEKTLSEEWNPKHLEELPSDKEAISAIGTAIGIAFSVIFMVVFNLYPEMINIPTNQLINAGLTNVHTIDMEVFRSYLFVLNIIWLSTILVAVVDLVKMKKTIVSRIMDIAVNFATIGLFYSMVTDRTLYVGNYNLIGFRGLILFLLIMSVIEVISQIVKFFVHS